MNVGFHIALEARDETVAQVEALLRDALDVAEEDDGMIAWFASRTGPTSFLMFNTFGDADRRQAHAAGEAAASFGARVGELLAAPPQIVEHEVLAQKLPG